MPNRLINETSPYLLQHAHNPVDWYPWGTEALERAQREDKPILLSIGYSACHWCHVMERKSFEDPEIARIMNENFVNIKVDREERPDIDSIYMQAVQAMTGHGGWPLTVFLTPEGKPFYGGTYFPPEDTHGMPSFRRVLEGIAQTWRERRAEIERATTQMVQYLRSTTQPIAGMALLTAQTLDQAFTGVAREFDERHGGVGIQPKFPQAMVYEFLLRYHKRTQNAQALRMVELTLERMARGGIYDQLGGGFHRYSTDSFWLVPHFEKMLYDNALLARLYLHAYQVTGKPLYRRIAQETLDYLLRDMADPRGGFYSSQDADSQGEEGKYYLWLSREIDEALEPEDARLFKLYYGVTPQGNFEGRNILWMPQDPARLAQEQGLSLEELEKAVQRGRDLLLRLRQQRVPPGRDDKVLTSWNGLMLRSLAEAAMVLGREDYLRAAVRSASFLLESLRPNGRLMRSYKDGRAVVKGYLEDYANLIDGLVTLYEATFQWQWLSQAQNLAREMLDLFWEPAGNGGTFYDTGKDAESLLVRPRDFFDNATPSGSAAATDVLQRLAVLTGDPEMAKPAVAMLRSMQELMARYPLGLAHWLGALDFYLSTPREIAVMGPRERQDTQALLEVVFRRYLPNKVLAGYDPSDGASPARHLPLLQGREMLEGRATAYVCENYACRMPVTEPQALAGQLE